MRQVTATIFLNPGLVYVPGEFELYIQNLVFPQQVRRLGADLMLPRPQQPRQLALGAQRLHGGTWG